MSLMSDIITRAREGWLQDASSVEWSDTRLLVHANDAHRWLSQRMSRTRNSRWFTSEQDIQLAANTESFDLTSLPKSFAAVRTLFFVPDNGPLIKIEPLGEGDEDYHTSISSRSASGQIPPRYFLRQEDAATRLLVFRPTAGSLRNFKLLYVYWPDVLPLGGTVLTPTEYDDLLAAELSRRAFLDEGESDDGLDLFIQTRLMDMQEDLATAHGESSGRRLRDTHGAWE
jgi:hypothetical protein